ncbi:MAG: radical SAM protein [Nanobdellota archaeon]
MIMRNMRSGCQVLGYQLFHRRAPLKINFISTYRCNGRCVYCDIDSCQHQQELTTAQAQDMIRSFRSLGAQHITFIGGEPLLREDLGELVSYAKRLKMLTTISSNALLFADASWLRHLDLFICCLNGPEDVHDATRGKGSYQKAMQVLSTSHGRFATMILTQQNINYMDFVLSKAKELSFWVNFQPVFYNELAKADAKDLDGIILSTHQVKEAFSYIKRRKRAGDPIVNSPSAIRHFAERGFARFGRCHHGGLSVTVDPSGNLYQCYKFVNGTGVNGAAQGWKEAYQSMPMHPCTDCHYGCHIEDNLLFNLDPGSILNLLKLGRIFTDG